LCLFKRWRYVQEHPGWTYADYDACAAGDLLLHDEFAALWSGLLSKDKGN
jgi:hypothetical protein